MILAEVDGNAVVGRAELHELFSEQLRLPAWYGKNLDALYDCLTEPGEEIVLTLRSPEVLEARLGGYARALLRMLAEAEKAGSRFRLVLADGAENTDGKA